MTLSALYNSTSTVHFRIKGSCPVLFGDPGLMAEYWKSNCEFHKYYANKIHIL